MAHTRIPVLLLLPALLLLGATAQAAESLAHETFVLENGLRVVLHEDHRLPLVVVNLRYQVGARDEPEGRSGFAHLFEHLMFMGTGRVKRGEYDRILEAAGGWSNASTGYDNTEYHVVAPSNLLSTVLWLEADRMEGLGKAITQEKLDLQRDVVRNEIRESYENESYGAADLRTHPEMYPPLHPYHMPVIGSHEDLAKATVAEVKRFFETYYVPNNATLVVAGDFEPKDAMRVIERYFGAVPPADEIVRRPRTSLAFEGGRTLTVFDDVNYARTTLTWHTPALYAPGDAEMDLLADLLAGGRQSALFKRLVHDERIAVDVSAWQISRRLGSLFQIQATVSLGVDPARVEQAIEEALASIRVSGPAEDALRRACVRFETEVVTGLQELLSVADSLLTYDAYFHDADRLAWDLDRYRNATREGLRDAARRFLRPGGHLVIRVLPRPAAPTPSPLDTRPEAAPAASFVAPVPAETVLENGLRVWHLDRPGAPLLAARLLVPAGSAHDTRETSGLSKLTSLMLREGAGQLDALAFAGEAEKRGATFWTWNERDSAGIGLEVLSRHAEEAMRLLGLAVTQPMLGEAEFERIRRRRVLGVPRLGEDAERLGSRVAWQLLFRDRVPSYALAPLGRADGMAGLAVEDVRDFYRHRYDPSKSVLVLAGDVRRADGVDLARRHLGVSRWQVPGAADAEAPEVQEAPASTRLVIVNRPDAEQTSIHLVLPALAVGHPDRPALDVATEILGGSFTSRLNDRLREREGLTYGAYASLGSYLRGGGIEASSSVDAARTGAAIASLRDEVARALAGEIDAEEVARAVETLVSRAIQYLAHLTDSTALIAVYAVSGRGPTGLREDLARLRAVDLAQVKRAIRAHLDFGQSILVLVGDQDVILPQIADLDLPTATVLTVEQALDL